MTTTVTAVDTVCPLPEVVSTVIPFLDLNHARGFNYSPRYRCLKSQSPLCAVSKTRPTILFIRMSNFILAKFSFRTLLLVYVCVCLCLCVCVCARVMVVAFSIRPFNREWSTPQKQLGSLHRNSSVELIL